MDFKDQLKQFSDRVEKLKDQIQTEEATKTAFVLPFIQMLGYDVFNPLEVIPEMVCDIGTKKGEKIDYCIMKDGEPIMLIECKHWKQDLSLHDNQLLRYFHVSKAKFGVLTNGIVYRFYTDLITPNKMDEVPFLEIDLLNLKDAYTNELKKFSKPYFNLDEILSTASELKYMSELRAVIQEEFKNPTPEFVKHFGKQVYSGSFTTKVSEQFAVLVKRAISAYINEIISDRLRAAIQSEEKPSPTEAQQAGEQEAGDDCSNDSRIVTTEEELEAFRIIRAILAKSIDVDRVFYRDALRYFTIIIDDSNRKNVCRLYLNSSTSKRVVFTDENNKEAVSHNIDRVEDLYQYADEFIASAIRYK